MQLGSPRSPLMKVAPYRTQVTTVAHSGYGRRDACLRLDRDVEPTCPCFLPGQE
jgi:hypothetical protein